MAELAGQATTVSGSPPFGAAAADDIDWKYLESSLDAVGEFESISKLKQAVDNAAAMEADDILPPDGHDTESQKLFASALSPVFMDFNDKKLFEVFSALELVSLKASIRLTFVVILTVLLLWAAASYSLVTEEWWKAAIYVTNFPFTLFLFFLLVVTTHTPLVKARAPFLVVVHICYFLVFVGAQLLRRANEVPHRDTTALDGYCWVLMVVTRTPIRYSIWFLLGGVTFTTTLSIEPVIGMPPPMTSYVLMVLKAFFFATVAVMIGWSFERREKEFVVMLAESLKENHIINKQTSLIREVLNAQIPEGILLRILEGEGPPEQRRGLESESSRGAPDDMTTAALIPDAGNDRLLGDNTVLQASEGTVFTGFLEKVLAKRLKSEFVEEIHGCAVVYVHWQDFHKNSSGQRAHKFIEKLHQLFECVADISEQMGMEQVKYSAGYFIFIPKHDTPAGMEAERGFWFATRLLQKRSYCEEITGLSFNISIGMTVGIVTAGIVGVSKWCYDMWGSAVNSAARLAHADMDGHGRGTVNMDEDTIRLVKSLNAEAIAKSLQSKEVNLKGIGMTTVYYAHASTLEGLQAPVVNADQGNTQEAPSKSDDGSHIVWKWNERWKTKFRRRPCLRILLSILAPEVRPVTDIIQIPMTLSVLANSFSSRAHENRYQLMAHAHSSTMYYRIVTTIYFLCLGLGVAGIAAELDGQCFTTVDCVVPLVAVNVFFTGCVSATNLLLSYWRKSAIVLRLLSWVMGGLLLLWCPAAIVCVDNHQARTAMARAFLPSFAFCVFGLRLGLYGGLLFILTACVELVIIQVTNESTELGIQTGVVGILIISMAGGLRLDYVKRRIYMMQVHKIAETRTQHFRSILYEKLLAQIYPPAVINHIKSTGRDDDQEHKAPETFAAPREFVGAVPRMHEMVNPGDAIELSVKTPPHDQVYANRIENCFVLQADLVGFTSLCRTLNSRKIVNLLHEIFMSFDALAKHFHIIKIKTVGDAYVAFVENNEGEEEGQVVGGWSPAVRMIGMSLGMVFSVMNIAKKYKMEISLRVGIAKGSCIGFLAGFKKMAHDIYGNAMDAADVLERTALPNTVNLDAEFLTSLLKLKNDKGFESLEIGVPDVQSGMAGAVSAVLSLESYCTPPPLRSKDSRFRCSSKYLSDMEGSSSAKSSRGVYDRLLGVLRGGQSDGRRARGVKSN